MRHKRHRPGGQRVGLGVAEGAQAVGDVGEAHASGAAQCHARRAGDRGKPITQPGRRGLAAERDARRVSRQHSRLVLVRVAEDDRARTADLGSQRELVLERGVRDREQCEIGHFRQVG